MEVLLKGFPRPEVIAITGINVDRLNYLDRTNTVVPYRYGSKKKPVLLFTWAQLIQLKLVDILKADYVNDVLISKILLRVNEEYKNPEFLNQNFIIYNDEVYWFDRAVDLKEVMGAIEKQVHKSNPNLASLNVYTPAPYAPLHKEYRAIEIKWNPYHSMRYVVVSLIINARDSKEIDFEDFKQKIDYDSFKDALQLE